MTESDGASAGRRAKMPSRWFVTIAFAAVGVLVLAATLSALAQVRGLQENARDIVDDMLSSVRIVGELDSDVEKRRILVGDHIFTSNTKEMASLEGQLGELDSRIARATREYDRWAVLPGEREVWNRARADLAALDAPIAGVLALSRENRDVEARRLMEEVAAAFARVDHEFDDLVAINNRGASADLERVSMIRFRLTATLLGIGLAALAGTALVGFWVSREVGRREEELARNARYLEARNRELDAFAGRVAHDIRGPLTAINLAMTPLAAKVPSDDRSFQILRRGARTMGALVDDLLTLARSEAEIDGCCDPAAVVQQLQEDFGARLTAEKGALRVSVAHAEVSCSEGLLRQALVNLLENAVKYHRPEVAPEVEVSGNVSEGGYELRVSDNGLGMSQEDARRAVEPFFRSAEARGLPGTGLGLSIVDRVARASGGTLSVESTLGRGSTFVVHLPLAEREARPAH